MFKNSKHCLKEKKNAKISYTGTIKSKGFQKCQEMQIKQMENCCLILLCMYGNILQRSWKQILIESCLPPNDVGL